MMAPPLVPLVIGLSQGLARMSPATAPRIRPVAMSLWEAYGGSESTDPPPPPPPPVPLPPSPPPQWSQRSPPPPSFDEPAQRNGAAAAAPVAYAAATPAASKLDNDRVCTVCVALLGQYGRVEGILEGGCGGMCSTQDGELDFGRFSALVDAMEVRCLCGACAVLVRRLCSEWSRGAWSRGTCTMCMCMCVCMCDPSVFRVRVQVQCSESDKCAVFAMVDSDGRGTVEAAGLKDALRSSGAITSMCAGGCSPTHPIHTRLHPHALRLQPHAPPAATLCIIPGCPWRLPGYSVYPRRPHCVSQVRGQPAHFRPAGRGDAGLRPRRLRLQGRHGRPRLPGGLRRRGQVLPAGLGIALRRLGRVCGRRLVTGSCVRPRDDPHGRPRLRTAFLCRLSLSPPPPET